jgi:hypothetical protein
LERDQTTKRGCGTDDISVLLLYLPIAIFEAMFEANENERKADESTVIE